jgi:hypothetical protein
MTPQGVKKLQEMLHEDYMDERAAPDMEAAIRDLMTDLFHVVDHEGLAIDLHERLGAANDVYDEECEFCEDCS